MVPQITGVFIVCLPVFSCADRRNYKNWASLAFERGIHRSLVDFSHKGPITGKMLPFDNFNMTAMSSKVIQRSINFYLFSIDIFLIKPFFSINPSIFHNISINSKQNHERMMSNPNDIIPKYTLLFFSYTSEMCLPKFVRGAIFAWELSSTNVRYSEWALYKWKAGTFNPTLWSEVFVLLGMWLKK